jgi:hypothetical protein
MARARRARDLFELDRRIRGMSTLRTTLAGAAVAALALATPAAPAAAAGSPLPAENSPNGVVSPNGASRYLSVTLAGRTEILQQRASTGAITSRLDLRGRFGIPLVAYDTTAGGISHDGRTLVLMRPRSGFPRRETTFALLSTNNFLRLRRTIRLAGDFSYDALSADGRSLFLINYISPNDPSKYRVRVFDLAHNRLVAKPVVDPRESPDEMNGLPVTRVVSPDGRWAYTLYDRPGKHPFIHALDTRDRTARCIDLEGPAFPVGGAYTLTLAIAARGARIDISRKGAPLASVDTATFRVSGAAATRAAAARASDHNAAGPGLGWTLLGVALLVGGLAAPGLVRRRRRHASAPVGSPDAKAPRRRARGLADPGAPRAGGAAGEGLALSRPDLAEAQDQRARHG